MTAWKTAVAVLTAALTFPAVAYAPDARGLFSVKGVGVAPCKRYVEARKEEAQEYLLFAGYLAGYVTAHNQLSYATFDILPWETIDTVAGLLGNFCAKNPEVNFGVAVSRLIKFLEPSRLATATDTVEARVGPGGVTIYRETLRRVQLKLTEAGHYKGVADGQFSPATRAALEKYQGAKGLPKTGLPDQTTLLRLLLVQSPPK